MYDGAKESQYSFFTEDPEENYGECSENPYQKNLKKVRGPILTAAQLENLHSHLLLVKNPEIGVNPRKTLLKMVS